MLRAEEGLRQSILRVEEEEAREGALEALRKAADPYQAAVRAYLRAVYEADRALTAALREGEAQV